MGHLAEAKMRRVIEHLADKYIFQVIDEVAVDGKKFINMLTGDVQQQPSKPHLMSSEGKAFT